MPTLDELTGGGTSLEELTQEVPQRGVGERILAGAARAPQNIIDMLAALPGQMLTGGRIATQAAGNLLTGQPQSPELGDMLRGALESLTLGTVKPREGASPDAVSAGQAVGGAAGFIPAVRGAKMALGAVPAIGGVLRNFAVPLVGALQGGGAAAIQGEDPIEGASSGFSTGVLGEGIGAAGKRIAKTAMGPGRQVLDIEEANAQTRIANAQKILADQQELQLRKVQNIEALKQHAEALRTAETNAAASNQAASEAFRTARIQAETQLQRAQAELPGAQERFMQLAERSRPGERPSDLYAPVNEAVAQGAPANIALGNTSKIIERVGGGIAKQTEGLPKAAGPSGRIEKLATGLAEEAAPGVPMDPKGALIAQMSPGFKANFSPGVLESMTETQLQRYLQAEKVGVATGVPVNDVVALSEGNLNIGQVDRLLQVFGKASGKSGVASEFFWSLQEDLRSAARSGDPLAQKLLDARRSWRQNVAADDLVRLTSPHWTPTGKMEVNPSKLASLFDARNKSPEAMRLRESFPPEVLQDISSTISEIYRVREGVRNAAAQMRGLPKKPPAPVKPERVAKPDLITEDFPRTPLKTEAPMQYRAPKGSLLRHPIIFGAAIASLLKSIFGIDLSFSVAGGGMAMLSSIVPESVFKMSVAIAKYPSGRDFLRTLFRNEPPNLNNPESIQAMITFLGTEAQRQQMERQR